MHDPVDDLYACRSHKDPTNPDHYTNGGIECIDYLQAKLSEDEFRGFLKGNIIKYVTRAEHKNGKEDYEKAKWYLDKLNEVTE